MKKREVLFAAILLPTLFLTTWAINLTAAQNNFAMPAEWVQLTKRGLAGQWWMELAPRGKSRIEGYVNEIARCLTSDQLVQVPVFQFDFAYSDISSWRDKPDLLAMSTYTGSVQDFQPSALPRWIYRLHASSDEAYSGLDPDAEIWELPFSTENTVPISIPRYSGGVLKLDSNYWPSNLSVDSLSIHWKASLISQINAFKGKDLLYSVSIEYSDDKYGKYIKTIRIRGRSANDPNSGNSLEYNYGTLDGIWIPLSFIKSDGIGSNPPVISEIMFTNHRFLSFVLSNPHR